ncbi:ABC transporter permease subunit [Actinoallomurus rhizosphaericola]|uniref:ABC transporter permease subunit n=1 Tax=Actinoallomurus rhizosphaericola TaxID=2952536 RepID=UPI0020902885|nr:ABC transporter permease subunit [Actinoallomurus rhizosphaericola]MCO5993048.1 ABC transporter permease subunit [Actinoallomurus rhizosphaericola]
MIGGLAARTAARELARQRRRQAVRRAVERAALYALATVASVLCAAPFLWSLWAAVHEVPAGESVRLLRSTPFGAWVGRTVLVGGPVTAVTVLLALPAAYALRRRRWGGTAGRIIAVLALVPSVLLAVPLSWAADGLGLGGSPATLVLVEPAITVPVAVLLFGGFLRAVPVDVEEQALVDGHSRLAAFVRVVVPLLRPAIAAVAVLAFTLAAGDLVYARALAGARSTVAAGIPAHLGHGAAPLWRSLHLGVVLVAVPLAAAADLVLGRIIAASAGTADRT